jgi:ferric hydroxamate transport system substrate-binding protein
MGKSLAGMAGVGLTRRQLGLGLLTSIAGWHFPAIAAPDQRVAALDWGLAESLLAVGIAPFAVAEAPLYADRVVEPALPKATIDLGLRSWPSLERLEAIRPDLIVAQAGYGISPERLAKIAPTVALPLYNEQRQPLMRAQEAIKVLSDRLGKTGSANAYLDRFADEQHRLAQRISGLGGVRPMLIIKFADDRLIDIYGRGSLFCDVLESIGLKCAWQGQTNAWGFTTAGLDAVARYTDAHILVIKPGPPTLMESALWRALPAVAKKRVTMVEPAWVFGAMPSALRFANLVTKALAG